MKGVRQIFAAFAAIAALSSCVHEFPVEPGVDPTTVDVDIRLLPSAEMGLYPNGNELVQTSTAENEALSARYYIHLYASTSEDFSIEQAELVWADTLYREPSLVDETMELSLELKALHYRMVVWQDLVDAATKTDKYWKVPSLTEVAAPLAEGYFGNDDHKMAQAATQEFDLTPHANEWDVQQAIDVQLYRPLSKFVLVADDLAEFVKSYKANYSVATEATAEDILSSCRFQLSYSGYMLTGYNAFRDKMNDSGGGYGFEARPAVLDEDNATVCFDYMLTGPETAVTLKLDIYDSAGKLINSLSGIEVPLARGQVTVIRGNYLTKDYGDGIGIDPGFEGEYNVQI